MSNWEDSLEIFYHDGVRYDPDDCWADSDENPLPAGWYYWSCFPGCMPDSDPYGPFETGELAYADARDKWGDESDGESDDES